ncbi:hypothetical protein THA_1339 [Thermosipho africanus TCF52B]|uniref:Uncharacterized protein n=1 Tax=Thermosipho africanus (strain TCF52B) TaxID=484019 RepID=B7ICQ7_THEAB|nr:hypothetical protein THA_1339 [Thermosipho africanus TCF52B]
MNDRDIKNMYKNVDITLVRETLKYIEPMIMFSKKAVLEYLIENIFFFPFSKSKLPF